jgi:hypothetical protein
MANISTCHGLKEKYGVLVRYPPRPVIIVNRKPRRKSTIASKETVSDATKATRLNQ